MMLIEEALSGTAEGRRIEFHTWNEKEEYNNYENLGGEL
jgi:hypothetical protein